MGSGIYKRTSKFTEIDFDKILQLVMDGWTISEAVVKTGLSSAHFYKKITEQQKQQIYRAKMLHSKHKRY
tara:strand:- start:1204 stop:1413 length:210 start_codon:yes stop_codon:yes gene_type:complete